jgi:hypothetical protein
VAYISRRPRGRETEDSALRSLKLGGGGDAVGSEDIILEFYKLKFLFYKCIFKLFTVF